MGKSQARPAGKAAGRRGPEFSVVRPQDQRVVEEMVRLAQQIGMALHPVDPRPEFIVSLKRSLQPQIRAVPPASPTQSPWFWAVLGIGGLAYVLGVTTLGLRVLSAAMAAVALMLGLRSARRPRARLRQAV